MDRFRILKNPETSPCYKPKLLESESIQGLQGSQEFTGSSGIQGIATTRNWEFTGTSGIQGITGPGIVDIDIASIREFRELWNQAITDPGFIATPRHFSSHSA
jgi:hypothetical protein